MKRVIIAVTNDLVSDQRVHKVAVSLMEWDCHVTLIGRLLPKSNNLSKRPYKFYRFNLPFLKGFKFYAVYNIRLFFYLLFSRFDIVVANDLDTLPACFFASKLRMKKIVYDSHEYFTEVPELIHRKKVRAIWLFLEKLILPKIKNTYTVSESIAEIYNRTYGTKFIVIRNVPFSDFCKNESVVKLNNQKIIIYQGALNLGRGIESVIKAMKCIENTVFWIIGEGDIREELKDLVFECDVSEKVLFTGKIPFEDLAKYTKQAHLGISLEESKSLNYYYSLPNKLFDYIHCHVPVLVSDLPEMRKIIDDYGVGEILESREPIHLANQITRMLTDETQRTVWENNLDKAASVLTWENEKIKLKEVYQNLL